ncbi:flagellar basal body P-ring protein FlgI [Burkholderia stagnalis]|uniref:flagellar basal body P-ring protein FlgI n=1 Tax=Burkholderia stagnalis TaxID=1503054 RepID=UPI000F5A4B20|nr:flagellar basal body P-ring protein FlgI [Burkholderia stagnalis]RQQ07095.1 flagellar basal body P-ring protein FlgI [Burkholderia stagnalis]RQQ94136.1 flagellar basal body P-ring protein FlgI [Burkholderia stagnalis]RQX85871.1 flagellar basal body P-ring protein FlgI [Burkholderia stagnalis]RQY75918.1 flagellar basal body P-ring protein FlgI [Burkholderia stagnalis]
MVKRSFVRIAWMLCFVSAGASGAPTDVRLKDLGRFLGWRDNMLVGYGIVTGLSGSGDTPRNQATRQAMTNMLSQFDLNLTQDQLQSRNAAMVMITASLPPATDVGDKLDVNVTSMGDARSLSGGTLIMTPLQGPDRKTYALAQGPVSVGGYRYDANGNLRQKNHPTAGTIPEGATVEVPVTAELVNRNGYLNFILKDADASTAERIATQINRSLGGGIAQSVDAKTVRIRAPLDGGGLNGYVARIESLVVTPDQRSRIVINERTGTVVAGGDMRIAPITISHGDIKVTVATQYNASQPALIGIAGPEVRSLIVGNSELFVDEPGQTVAASFPHGSVGELVQALKASRISTRDVIAILEAIKAAGALHADIIVQ